MVFNNFKKNKTLVVENKQHMIDEVFTSLGLSPEESKTWMALLESGPAPAGQLAQRMGAPRPSVYGFLKRLVNAGAVLQSTEKSVTIFTAAAPQALQGLLRSKIEKLERQQSGFTRLIPELEKKIPLGAFKPRFEFFEGREGVQNVLSDMLLYSGIETRSYWPMQAMIDLLGDEFFHNHNKIRIQNRTSVKAIWPQGQIVSIKDHPSLGAGKDYLREIRIAPPDVDFSMGYWIYRNKTAFLASQAESFGFIIESAELAQMMLSQHELMWKNSKKLTINTEDIKPFLRDLKKD